MNRNEIMTQVNALMQKGFEVPPEKLVPGANLFTDLGLDSLDAIDMLVHLEDRFHVKIAADELAQVRTLADVYKLVEQVGSSAEVKR